MAKTVIAVHLIYKIACKTASECLSECSSPGFLILGENVMYIVDQDYFIRSILASSEEELTRVLQNVSRNYRQFSIPKNGGKREISAIDKESALARLQANLARNFLNKLPLPTPVVGFVPEKSYIDFLKPHIAKKYFLRIDIHDFFGSVEESQISLQLEEYFSESCYECVDFITSLCMLDGKLPQGAITSPTLSNIVFRRVDQRIMKYCQSFDSVYVENRRASENIIYTRYADDLLFSSDAFDFSKNLYFLGMIRKILKNEKFKVNEKKTRFGYKEITLSGYVLSRNIHLSRKKMYSINKVIHYFGKTDHYERKKYRIKNTLFAGDWITGINMLKLQDGQGNEKHFGSAADVLNYLCGYRAFIISIIRGNPKTDNSIQQLQRKVHKLELIIDAVTAHST